MIGVVVDELFEVMAGPLGGVPEADAVLMIEPEFTSDWVMVRVAVHVVEPPGASVVNGHEITDKPVSGSVTLIAVRVTLPVFVTTNENVCTSPSDGPTGTVSVVSAADFDSDRALSWVIGVDVDEMFEVIAGPDGGVPEAVAVLLMEPAFTLACVMVRVAVHVVDAPGASVVDGQLTTDSPGRGSETATDVSVTFPVLVTTNENVCTSPNDAPVGAVSEEIAADLVRVIVFTCVMEVVTVDWALTVEPEGTLPVAVAVLMIDPAFTSAWVIVRVAVQVNEAPAASVVAGQLMTDKPARGSVTPTVFSGTDPMLVTRNEKVTVSPRDAPVGVTSVVTVADLVSESAKRTVSESVAELLAALVSVEPAGAATAAVLEIVLSNGALGLTVAVMTYVADVPLGRVTVVEMALPDPLPPPHAAPAPDGVQVQLTPVRLAGTVSVTGAAVAVDGPALATTTVYDNKVPGTASTSPSVLVIDRSTCGVTLSVSVAALLPGVGSGVPAAAVAVAVLASVAVPAGVAGFSVPLTANVATPFLASVSEVLIEFPDPVVAVHVDPAVAEQVQVTPVSAAGTASVKPAGPPEVDGPLLATVIVYDTAVPGTALVMPSVFVTTRSALRSMSSTSVAELLAVFVSV